MAPLRIRVRVMFETVVGTVWFILIVAAFLEGGTMGGIYAICGVLGFGALFEILGLWD